MLACSRHGSVGENCCRFMKITQVIVSFLLQIDDSEAEGVEKSASPSAII